MEEIKRQIKINIENYGVKKAVLRDEYNNGYFKGYYLALKDMLEMIEEHEKTLSQNTTL